MCLILLHFQPCAGSEPECNCCVSHKYTYMQLRSPEVTRVNFDLSDCYPLFLCLISCLRVYLVCPCLFFGHLSSECYPLFCTCFLVYSPVSLFPGCFRINPVK